MPAVHADRERRTQNNFWAAMTALVLAVAVVGCAAEAPPADEPADEEPMPETMTPVPEVFFDTVQDGGTYASPVNFVFSVDNFEIVPIEDPLVVRPGEGHYHLAVNVPCADAGEIIVAGNPSYIHFGTGNDQIEMQLEPGSHSLCLQVADGEHRVIDGPEHSLLTKEVQITVE